MDGPRTVTGTGTLHHLADTGEATEPIDFTGAQIAALVPGTWDVIAGTGGSGTFTIPNVPAGTYYLRFQEADATSPRFFVRSSSTIDMSYYVLGRLDVQWPQNPTVLTLNLTGLTAWQSVDLLEFWSASADTHLSDMSRLASVGAPSTGATSLTGMQVDFAQTSAGLIDGSKGDVAIITQQVTTTVGGFGYFTVDKVYAAPSFTMTDGQPTTLTGAFSAVPQSESLTVDWKLAAFDGLMTAVNPSAVCFLCNTWTLRTVPATWTPGQYYPDRSIALADGWSGAGADANVTYQYGNPYPSSWDRTMVGGGNYQVEYTAPGATEAGTQLGWIFARSPVVAGTSNVTIAPVVSPVQGLKVNGADAFQAASGITLTPTLSWSAPATGQATSYSVYVLQVKNQGGYTDFATAAVLLTKDTSVTVAPDILQTGNSYVFEVTSEVTAGVDLLETPNLESTTYAAADALTAMFTP